MSVVGAYHAVSILKKRRKRKQNITHVNHNTDDIMGAIASQITRLASVYSIVNSGADQRKYQSSASLAFVRGILRGPVKSPHKWPVTRKMFPFYDVIMFQEHVCTCVLSFSCVTYSCAENWDDENSCFINVHREQNHDDYKALTCRKIGLNQTDVRIFNCLMWHL